MGNSTMNCNSWVKINKLQFLASFNGHVGLTEDKTIRKPKKKMIETSISFATMFIGFKCLGVCKTASAWSFASLLYSLI